MRFFLKPLLVVYYYFKTVLTLLFHFTFLKVDKLEYVINLWIRYVCVCVAP